MVDALTSFEGNVTTANAALEVSGTSWNLRVGDPADTSKTGVHKLAPHDLDGLLRKLGQARRRASASGEDVRVLLVYEAGYEWLWLARRLGGEDLEVVVRDPASLEVFRRRKKAKTDRIDARKRGPCAGSACRITWAGRALRLMAMEEAMTLPVVGIIGNAHLINREYPVHSGGRMISVAVREVAGAVPLIVPADPDLVSIEELMSVCDGFLFPGGRANVHPEEYGEEPTTAHGDFDRARDKITLPLIRECVAAGQPILAICRGFQELNTAMGGSLHPEIRELPGRMNHRMPPDGTLDEKFGLRHEVALSEGGVFHRLFGATTVLTNTLHGQGIKETGERIVIDGRAEDGTEEAIYVESAPGFALGVQWHPEYKAAEDPVSRALFEAFGEAVRDWAAGARPARLRSA